MASSAVNPELSRLVSIVDRLLAPGGCPWDRAQTHETLKSHLLEESYEVLEAIDRGNLDELRKELGDLLLQPILHAQMEKAAGRWDIEDVAREISDKLVRRHPHVFGDVDASDSETVLQNWDQIKLAERDDSESKSILAGVPKSMPALLRAHEISKRAARAGFEWASLHDVFLKLAEEEAELMQAIETGEREQIESEIGDWLFTMVNIARWCKVEPEDALRRMIDRFNERFQAMEAAAGKPLRELTAEEWDRLWNEAKRTSS